LSVEPRRGVVVAARGWDILGTLLALAASVRRGTVRLAVLALVSALAIGSVLLRDGLPESTGAAVVKVLTLVLAFAPPIVLAAFWLVLRELLDLPERLRRMPREAREHGEELRRVVDAARARPGGVTIPLQLWRLARLSARSRELLSVYAPIAPLLSPAFLAAVAVSAAAAVAEAVVALIVLLVLAGG
jgi:hypothetical protein